MTGTPVRLLSAREEGLAPDLELGATLYVPAAPSLDASGAAPLAPALVVGHGAGSRASRHAEFCMEACRRGFVVLAPDFRGHGDSEGRADGPMEQDVLSSFHYLRGHPAVDPDSICYRGSSMGGFYGLKAAPLADFAAMVLICPAGRDVMIRSIDDDGEERGDTEAPEHADPRGSASVRGDADSLGGVEIAARTSSTRWDRPQLRAYFERQDSLALAAQVHCPVLLVHARPDEKVPLSHSLALAQHLPGNVTLLVLCAGNHSSAQHDPVVHAQSLDWLWEQIRRRHAATARC